MMASAEAGVASLFCIRSAQRFWLYSSHAATILNPPKPLPNGHGSVRAARVSERFLAGDSFVGQAILPAAAFQAALWLRLCCLVVL
jgi:hypothetical protein